MVVNSVGEQYLYVMLQQCGCGGSYDVFQQGLSERKGLFYDTLYTKCNKCKNKKQFEFDINRFYGDLRLHAKFNPFDRHSSVIDVVQWLNLASYHRAISREAKEEDKKALLRRSLGCINEALKFYQSGSPYPPDESYFNMPEGGEITEELRAATSIERVVNFKSEVEEELEKLK